MALWLLTAPFQSARFVRSRVRPLRARDGRLCLPAAGLRTCARAALRWFRRLTPGHSDGPLFVLRRARPSFAPELCSGRAPLAGAAARPGGCFSAGGIEQRNCGCVGAFSPASIGPGPSAPDGFTFAPEEAAGPATGVLSTTLSIGGPTSRSHSDLVLDRLAAAVVRLASAAACPERPLGPFAAALEPFGGAAASFGAVAFVPSDLPPFSDHSASFAAHLGSAAPRSAPFGPTDRLHFPDPFAGAAAACFDTVPFGFSGRLLAPPPSASAGSVLRPPAQPFCCVRLPGRAGAGAFRLHSRARSGRTRSRLAGVHSRGGPAVAVRCGDGYRRSDGAEPASAAGAAERVPVPARARAGALCARRLGRAAPLPRACALPREGVADAASAALPAVDAVQQTSADAVLRSRPTVASAQVPSPSSRSSSRGCSGAS
jgi:hypothetical protein